MPSSEQSRKRLVAGCMTGTSLDGLDAALTEITGTGLEMKARFIGMVSRPLGELREELRHFASGGAAEPLRYLRAARRLGELHAEAVAELCEKHLPRGEKLDFVVAHGQTIWHAPDDPDTRATSGGGVSWQLFDPWPIVSRLKVPVCYDLRQADLIAGGQGAPITPMADWILFPHPSTVVNLGGICNISFVTPFPEHTFGGDVCPCNLLIDGVVKHLFPPQRYDEDGRIAVRGVNRGLEELLPASFSAVPEPRSLGREEYSDSWAASIADQAVRVMRPDDVVASAVSSVAREIGYFIEEHEHPGPLILAGGGSRNPALVGAIRASCAQESGVICLSDELGVPVEAREALGFAVLGALSQDDVRITLPQVTGAKNPGRAGAWVYP
jgi:anhydro-N-acetylmuramic acid kinase